MIDKLNMGVSMVGSAMFFFVMASGAYLIGSYENAELYLEIGKMILYVFLLISMTTFSISLIKGN